MEDLPETASKAVSARIAGSLRRKRPLWRFLRALCRAVEAAGGSAYLTGGTVRDLAEGRAVNDIDIMVAGIGFPGIGRLLRSLPARRLGIRRIVQVGKAFAVYKVRTSWSGTEIDVAPAGSGRQAGSGRRHFRSRTRDAEARDDAGRRDFTINSVMFALRTEKGRLTGTVVDFFGGLSDLRRKLIRGVGDADERLSEDPLRMLRAIRQKNERKGYSIERKTWAAIRRAAPGSIGTIPGERVMGELLLALSADPDGTLDDLRRSGILPLLFPEYRSLRKGALSRIKLRYALLDRRLGRPLPEYILLANLLVDFADAECRGRRRVAAGKRPGRVESVQPGESEGEVFRLPLTEGIARRLRFPGVKEVVRLLEDLGRLKEFRRIGNRRARLEGIFDRWGSPGPLLALYEAASAAAGRKQVDFLPLIEGAARRPRLISGRQLLELGIPQGPGMDRILEQVREATLASKITSAPEAEALALKIHERKPA